ncbi:Failed axon connections [Chionoecetes opilio]|uniref:Failed axon connections n=1 Tax=Chionoecetes opilio TaxID=41210 RepID=A0A8J4YEW9_CHIOP|nr:Failed axon connections [Chionoecetes opilio]
MSLTSPRARLPHTKTCRPRLRQDAPLPRSRPAPCQAQAPQLAWRDCHGCSGELQGWNVDHKMKYKSKKGQLPFVEVNGEEIADSAIVIKELGSRYNTDLDSSLTAEQRNVAHATISMIENHFAWYVHTRPAVTPVRGGEGRMSFKDGAKEMTLKN